MLETIVEWDYTLFKLINGSGPPFIDSLMILLSDKLIWVPLYLWIIFKLAESYRHNLLWVLVPLVLAVVISDQVTSAFMKPFFERLRPCRDPLLSDTVIIVSKCGGRYGFASSHAANTMALGMFSWLYFRNSFAWGMITWALLVGLSRIYLGVHFPGDVVVGALIGIVAAITCYLLIKIAFPSALKSP